MKYHYERPANGGNLARLKCPLFEKPCPGFSCEFFLGEALDFKKDSVGSCRVFDVDAVIMVRDEKAKPTRDR